MSKFQLSVIIFSLIVLLFVTYDATVKHENIQKELDNLNDNHDKLTKSHLELIEVNRELEGTINALKVELQSKESEIKRLKKSSVSRGVSRNVPPNNSRKSYMDYRKITNTTSKQYELQLSPSVYTNDNGLRKYGGSYLIAVGAYYSNNIGDKLIIHMKNGKSFNAVVGDIKDNNHTDETNRQHLKDGSVVEFIVNVDKLPTLAKKMGDISYVDDLFMGEILSIEREND